MSINFFELLSVALRGLSDILTVAIAIISVSLLLFSFTFQLHDRITITYTLILLCVVIVFGADAFTIAQLSNDTLIFLLQLEWIGIILLPTAYFHFSDALLALTGKPSRWRRRLVGRVCIVLSIVFLVFLFSGNLVGDLRITDLTVPSLTRTFNSDIFAFYFLIIMLMSWYNIVRAFQRTTSVISRRRMTYLMVGAIGPAFGAFPFLIYGSGIASAFPIIFWFLSVISNIGVAILIVFMAYAVSFYGFSWPDRVIKRRLLKLVLRGPITAIITLAVTTLITRLGSQLGPNTSALTVLGMVGSIIFLQLGISILSPTLESWLLWGEDREELKAFRELEDRLLTSTDYVQFQNMLLASLSDRLQASGGFLCEINGDSSEIITYFGKLPEDFSKRKNEFIELLSLKKNKGYIAIKEWFLLELAGGNEKKVIGFIAEYLPKLTEIDQEQIRPIERIAQRAGQAIEDRRAQEALIQSMESINPRVSVIQQLMAASRFDRKEALISEIPLFSKDFDEWVKDALSQMWGGPKMTENPLMQLEIVKNRVLKLHESDTVALREVLKAAINKTRPEGQRLYTNEWIIFNILDLKYIEGWKVKDIARKLALSEADFFRKQRVAFNQVAHELKEMENQTSRTNA